MMLEFALWPLWKALKGPLKSTLNDKFSIVGGQFKALLSSTMDDLIAATQDAYWSTDLWKHLCKADVRKRKESADRFEYELFPLNSILESSKIRQALVSRLKKNVKLDAVRTEAGVSDPDWMKALDDYSGNLLRFGLPIAIKKMIRHELPLHSQTYLVSIAEAEAIKIDKTSGHHRLVILYQKSSSKGAPKLGEATKTWDSRNDDSYEYNLGDYDGFKAL
jgi:hypothetical protein